MNLQFFDKEYKHTFRVDETVYTAFQICSGDKNPLHTDVDFAKGKGFKGCVMYGNILNAFVSYFIGMLLPTKDVIIHSQDIGYKNPLFLDDELVFTAKVSGIFEAVNAVEFKFNFKNKENKIVANGHIQIGLL